MIAFARMLDRVDAIVGYAADHGLLHEVEQAMDAADNGQVLDLSHYHWLAVEDALKNHTTGVVGSTGEAG
jgi:hypothetical protein